MNLKRKICILLGTLLLFNSVSFADAIDINSHNYGNDYTNMVLVFGGIILVLIIVVLVIAIIAMKKKNSKKSNINNEENNEKN